MGDKWLGYLKAVAVLIGIITIIAGIGGGVATVNAELRTVKADQVRLQVEQARLQIELDNLEPVILEVRERLAGIEARLEILIQDRHRAAP